MANAHRRTVPEFYHAGKADVPVGNRHGWYSPSCLRARWEMRGTVAYQNPVIARLFPLCFYLVHAVLDNGFLYNRIDNIQYDAWGFVKIRNTTQVTTFMLGIASES